MGPIIDYQIIVATSYVGLSTVVQSEIASGWEPQGGVQLADHARRDEYGPTWAQAMVKRQGE